MRDRVRASVQASSSWSKSRSAKSAQDPREFCARSQARALWQARMRTTDELPLDRLGLCSVQIAWHNIHKRFTPGIYPSSLFAVVAAQLRCLYCFRGLCGLAPRFERCLLGVAGAEDGHLRLHLHVQTSETHDRMCLGLSTLHSVWIDHFRVGV